jgi:dihydrofolate reductase
MIKMIAAVSINGVIGVDGKIPWNYPDDMAFFRTMTKNSIVVMGRKTLQSMGNKPLPNRDNRVVSSVLGCKDGCMAIMPGIACYSSLKAALEPITLLSSIGPKPDIWLMGGESIYSDGLEHADEIYLTLIPERVETAGHAVARFPFIHPLEWQCEPLMMGELVPEAGEQKLAVAVYKRSKTNWKT